MFPSYLHIYRWFIALSTDWKTLNKTSNWVTSTFPGALKYIPSLIKSTAKGERVYNPPNPEELTRCKTPEERGRKNDSSRYKPIQIEASINGTTSYKVANIHGIFISSLRIIEYNYFPNSLLRSSNFFLPTSTAIKTIFHSLHAKFKRRNTFVGQYIRNSPSSLAKIEEFCHRVIKGWSWRRSGRVSPALCSLSLLFSSPRRRYFSPPPQGKLLHFKQPFRPSSRPPFYPKGRAATQYAYVTRKPGWGICI